MIILRKSKRSRVEEGDAKRNKNYAKRNFIMYIKLHATDLNEIILDQHFSRNYQEKASAVEERVTRLDSVFGKGEYREMFFEGIHIGYGDLFLRSTTLLQFETDFETVEMHFDLLGSSQASFVEPGTIAYEFGANSHNIIYVPGTRGNMLFTDKGSKILEINIRPQVFLRYIPEQAQESFLLFVKRIRSQTHALISDHNMPITPDMHMIIQEIMDCQKAGMYKRMFLESKVIELLMLQMEQIAQHDCEVFCSLRKKDYEKIHYAKEIVLARMDNPCSLVDLAKLAGTNQFTLKKGFKELFGVSVFGMISDLKMEKAKQLLLDKEQSITEVSEAVGYKNATHFTTAFKRKFGVTPGKYKDSLGS